FIAAHQVIVKGSTFDRALICSDASNSGAIVRTIHALAVPHSRCRQRDHRAGSSPLRSPAPYRSAGPRGLTSGQLSYDRSQRVGASAEFFGETYEKPFGTANVAEPIGVFVLDHFIADELRAVLTEPGERLVDVVHGEHDAQEIG